MQLQHEVLHPTSGIGEGVPRDLRRVSTGFAEREMRLGGHPEDSVSERDQRNFNRAETVEWSVSHIKSQVLMYNPEACNN